MDEQQWDTIADVVVLGSGAAGLVAAITAHDHGAGDVLIVEKSGMVGGTSAMSGGMMWIPLNHHQPESGVDDSYDEVVAYLDACAPGLLEPDPLAAFLESGPEMIRFLEDNTPFSVRLYPGIPDYQSNAIGAKAGCRSLDNDVFPFEELGSMASRVNPPKWGVPRLTSRVEDRFGNLTDDELDDRRRRDCRGQGQALVGSLFKGVLDRSIPVMYEARARHLCREGDRVVGVTVEQNGRTLRVGARQGVVIATGGFEWNEKLVKSFLRGPMTGPISVPECEGDGLLMAMEVGASLGNMANAWWMTSTKESDPAHRDAKANFLPSQGERTFPGSIMVNRSARRFVNEAANYNIIGYVLHNVDANTYDYPNLPYWLVFDDRFNDTYRVFTSWPGQPVPDFVTRADTIEELAEKIGVDPAALRDTVERFNGDVRNGHDSEFQRGASAYDNQWGDPTLPAPYSTLGVIDRPPYYAVEMEAGVNGTSGGPRANAHAQVLDWNDDPIDGLYICSNAMAAVTSLVYGGAGGTLGPGMTFGFIAGRHAALKG